MKKKCIRMLFVTSIIFTFLFIDFLWAKERPLDSKARSHINELEKQLRVQQKELTHVDWREKSILSEIERLERDAEIQKKSLRELSSKTEGLVRRIRENQIKISTLEKSIRTAEENLKNRIVAFYKFGRPGYIWLLAANDSLAEFQRTIKYVKVIIAQDKKILDSLSKKKYEIDTEIGMLKKNRGMLEELIKTEDRKIALVEKDIEKKTFLLMKAHREREFYQKAVEELRDATKVVVQTIVSVDEESNKALPPNEFANMKGKLSSPLKGRIMINASGTGPDKFMHRKGIYIKASTGDKIRSVFNGRVVFSGWIKGYGQLIIVDHGDRYFTMFAHLEERKKEKGDMVSCGEVIGLAGDTGWSKGSGIYFEIRRGRDKLDPKIWIRKK